MNRDRIDDPWRDLVRRPVTVGENGVVDVAWLLAAGLPEPPRPDVLTRADGHALFYRGRVNVLFGDPESGKSWIGYAAVVDALRRGLAAAVFDLDHNPARDVVLRLLDLGADADDLADPARFALVQPLDAEELRAGVRDVAELAPAVAVIDSVGEVLPLLGLSSNSPDEWSYANRLVLTPLAERGASVVAIDHLPKNGDARSHGQTGTLAKRRTTSGVSLRVTVHEAFAPGRGGSANLAIDKDRPGGLRAVCPPGTGRSQPAGRFVMEPGAAGMRWWITDPDNVSPGVDPAAAWTVRVADVEALDELDPPPESVRDVQTRKRWRAERASATLAQWRRGGNA